MKSNQAGQIVITEDDFLEILYRGQTMNRIVVEESDWISRYEHLCNLFEIEADLTWEMASTATQDRFVEQCFADWGLPEQYEEFDVEQYVLSKCSTQEQVERVNQELKMFKERNMMPVLKFLKYFVDTLHANDMICGVGRGSSVASYVLYLLDVHKVNSLEYELTIDEFLK
jgi:DNA polymerase III alpha subunit